ncbi:hypothetical protein ACQVBX_09490 [Dyella sp. KULCS107]|uniref:hypothetical protein n=1 Tax=Dyella sp. KULCS107 TaxID=3422216 RepID=UPI003D6FE0B5
MATNVNTAAWMHRAWADGSSWSKIAHQVRQNVIKTVTSPISFTACADDVAALERVDDPAVPAGRAYPGAVVGGSRSDRVKALVHAAALAPDERDALAH